MDNHQSGESGSGLELETRACGRGKVAHTEAFKIATRSEMWNQIDVFGQQS